MPLFLVAVPRAEGQTSATWDGGVGSWTTGTLWTPDGVPNSATADVYIDGSKTGTASDATLDATVGIGRLTIDAGDRLSLGIPGVTPVGASLSVQSTDFAGAGTILNNGTIAFNGVGPYAGAVVDLRFDGDSLSITGIGTLLLSDSSNNRIFGGTLTIGSGQTIQGAGRIGEGFTTIVNNGVLNGTGVAYPLLLQPGVSGLTNNGILRASGGGSLEAQGGAIIHNGAGTIEALNGSTIYLGNLSTVNGGTLSNAGSGAIRGVGGILSNVTHTNTAVALVANNSLTLAGTFTNNGTVRLSASGAYVGNQLQIADLRFDNASVALAGSGTILMTDSTNNRIFGGTLTIGANQTLEGGARIGEGVTTIINNGLINATGAVNGIVLQPNANALTNNGILRASGGGLLQLQNSAVIENANGTIEALANSRVLLPSGSQVNGGTLSSAGNGVITAAGGRLSNVTHVGPAISLVGGEFITLVDTFTNNGTVSLGGVGANINSPAAFADIVLSGNVSLAGTGGVAMTDSGNNRIYGETSSNVLTVGAGQTIRGGGRIGETNSGLINNGTVEAAAPVHGLTIFSGIGGRPIVNNGTFSASNGTLLLDDTSGKFTNNGLFHVGSTSAGVGTASLVVDAAGLTNYDSGTQTLTGGTYQIINTGNAPSTMNLGGGPIATNAANISLVGLSNLVGISSLATNSGTFTVGSGSFTTAGALANSGNLGVSSGTFAVSGGLTNSGRAVVANALVSATGAVTQTAAGRLAGVGTFSASSLTLNGTVAPGDTLTAVGTTAPGVGTLTLVGNTSFATGAVFDFAVAGSAATSDHLKITGNLTLDGTINIAGLAGYGAGSYALFDYSGSLNDLVLTIDQQPEGFYGVIDTDENGLIYLVVNVPEPTSAIGLACGAAMLLQRRRGRSPRRAC